MSGENQKSRSKSPTSLGRRIRRFGRHTCHDRAHDDIEHLEDTVGGSLFPHSDDLFPEVQLEEQKEEPPVDFPDLIPDPEPPTAFATAASATATVIPSSTARDATDHHDFHLPVATATGISEPGNLPEAAATPFAQQIPFSDQNQHYPKQYATESTTIGETSLCGQSKPTTIVQDQQKQPQKEASNTDAVPGARHVHNETPEEKSSATARKHASTEPSPEVSVEPSLRASTFQSASRPEATTRTDSIVNPSTPLRSMIRPGTTKRNDFPILAHNRTAFLIVDIQEYLSSPQTRVHETSKGKTNHYNTGQQERDIKEESSYLYDASLPRTVDNIALILRTIRAIRRRRRYDCQNLNEARTCPPNEGPEVVWTYLESLTNDRRDMSIDYQLSGPWALQIPTPEYPARFLKELMPRQYRMAPITDGEQADGVICDKCQTGLNRRRCEPFVRDKKVGNHDTDKITDNQLVDIENTGTHTQRQGDQPEGNVDYDYDEILLPKTSSNPFVSTNLHYILTNLQIEQLIVVGQLTEQCVEGTVRSAADLGYLVTLVHDACAAMSEEAHDRGLKNMKGFARIVSSEQVVEELLESEKKLCVKKPLGHEVEGELSPRILPTSTTILLGEENASSAMDNPQEKTPRMDAPKTATPTIADIPSQSKVTTETLIGSMLASSWNISPITSPSCGAAHAISLLTALQFAGVKLVRYHVSTIVAETVTSKSTESMKTMVQNDSSSQAGTKFPMANVRTTHVVPLKQLLLAATQAKGSRDGRLRGETFLDKTATFYVPSCQKKMALLVRPDLASLRILPFIPTTAVVMCNLFHPQEGRVGGYDSSQNERLQNPSALCGRSLLHRVQHVANDRFGLSFRVKLEIQFCVFRLDGSTRVSGEGRTPRRSSTSSSLGSSKRKNKKDKGATSPNSCANDSTQLATCSSSGSSSSKGEQAGGAEIEQQHSYEEDASLEHVASHGVFVDEVKADAFTTDVCTMLQQQNVHVEEVRHIPSASQSFEMDGCADETSATGNLRHFGVVLEWYRGDMITLADSVLLVRETVRACAKGHKVKASFLPFATQLAASESFRGNKSLKGISNAVDVHIALEQTGDEHNQENFSRQVSKDYFPSFLVRVIVCSMV